MEAILNQIRKAILAIALLIAHLQCNSQQAFTNPLLPSGADPWSIHQDGFYYYTNTLGNRIDIWKTRDLASLGAAERKTVWTPPPGTTYSRQLWAPEIHFIDNRWYIYFAADDGRNENHRMYVIENSSRDPMQGEWVLRGKVADASDKWAIDGTVFSHDGKMYMLWSGWEGDVNGRQNIYIARMENPWTISGERVLISTPEYAWELHGDLNDDVNPPHVAVNEGPQFLRHGKKVFVVYSASGCWTDHYSLGILSASADADLMDPDAWTKSLWPVFSGSAENKVWAPGHNSFFKSPDGKEDWILYHANDQPGKGCGKFRSPRAQKFVWRADGFPDFGTTVRTGVAIPAPGK